MSRNYKVVGLLLLAALLLSACQPVVAQPQAPPSEEEVTAAVNAIWDEYEASIEAGDADRWGELWVDDGVKYPPDAPLLAGKEAIVDNMREWMAMATASDVMVTNQDVQVAGDFAFVRGLFRVDAELKANGMPVVMDGKYMSILQRQSDGSWKLYRDIFNSNVPPAAPLEPDVAAVTAEIEALFTEYGDSLAADDAERWIQLWVEDGVQLPPNAPPNVGRDVIFASISGAMEVYAYRDMDIHVDEVLVAGDLAIARGMYTVSLVPRDGSDPILVDGKYTTTFQRQADGSWKIYRDIFNSNLPPAAPPSAEATDVDAATEAIKALWEEYSASALAGDPERRLALWAEDGIQMPPDREPRFGKDTIRAATEAGMANFVANEFVVTPEEVQVFGDLAFARGIYSANRTPVSGGDPILTDGKFMTILQRQADGSWKIYRDIFNSNVPPVPAAAPTTDVAAVAEAIDAVWREYEASQIAGDPDRWIALWADDGVQLPPGSPPVVGKAAIDARDRSDLEVNDYSHFVITNREVEVNGDLAFARGDFMVTVAPKSGGDSMDFEGKYMTIFRQQPDGSWKIYRDIFNPSAPSESEAADGADIAALSAELHQRFSDNDLEGAAALADENMKMVGFGLGLDLEGREQFLNFMKARKRAFPDITLQHTNIVEQGDQVVVEFVATGTHLGPLMTPNGEIEATGKPVTLHVVEIHTWKDGKLVNLVQYQDPTSPLRQIGVLQ